MYSNHLRKETLNTLSANFSGQKQKTNKKTMDRTKSFELRAVNTTDKDVVFALVNGTFTKLEEIQKCYPQVDAIAKDGVIFSQKNADDTDGAVTLSSKGQKTILHFRRFADKIDMMLKSLELVSSDETNFAQVVGFTATSPFGTNNMDEIRLAKFKDKNQFDTTRVDVEDINLGLTGVTLLTFTVAKKSELDICLELAELKRK